jgi:hypothetical protein
VRIGWPNAVARQDRRVCIAVSVIWQDRSLRVEI